MARCVELCGIQLEWIGFDFLKRFHRVDVCSTVPCPREGKAIHALANELVPGFVAFSRERRIPVDTPVVHSMDLEIDESSSTGKTEVRRTNNETCAF